MKQHPKHKGVPQHYGRGKPQARGKVVKTTHVPGMKKAETVQSCFRTTSGMGAVVFALAWMIAGAPWRRRS